MSDDPRWREWPVIQELYRQWRRARGGKLSSAVRPFSRDWQKLIAAAGLHSAAGQAEAARDVRLLKDAGLLLTKTARYSPDKIERVVIPLEAEPRWRALFGGADAAVLRDAAILALQDAAGRLHPRIPSQWRDWCEGLAARLRMGRHIRPLNWRDERQLRCVLEMLFGLTAPEWAPMTPVRAASVELGFDSKALERQQALVEGALTQLMGANTTFASLGLVGAPLLLMMNGPLHLDFGDGSHVDFAALNGCYGLAEADLERAAGISTKADRLLTVENVKTTFHQIVAANRDAKTLVVASSYATPAIQHLMRKLAPASIPHFHFGDTDAFGFHILHTLREASPRPIQPFLMRYRPMSESDALDAKSRRVAETLLRSENMSDCWSELDAMLRAEKKGDYEQETYGPPNLFAWPFFDTGSSNSSSP